MVLLNFEDDTSVVEIAFSRLEQKEMSLKSKKHIRKLFLRSPKEEGEVYQEEYFECQDGDAFVLWELVFYYR